MYLAVREVFESHSIVALNSADMFFFRNIVVIMRYHLPYRFPLPFWSMQRSRKNRQPFVFRPDRIGGFMSNELAMYSGLFWNKEAFSFRSRLPKLVSILLPLISLDFRCCASKTSTNLQLSRFYGWLLKKFYARPPMPKLEWRALRFFMLMNHLFGAKGAVHCFE